MTATELTSADGATLALHDLGGEGPPLLAVHGTSFHARVLEALVRPLSGRRLLGLDLRGHGRSGAFAPEDFEWDQLPLDVVAAIDSLPKDARAGLIGVGHSAGASALLMAAARRPGCFERLYLFEPIALDPEIRAAEELPPPLAGAARRRAVFGSREEAFEYLRGRPPLSFIDAEVFAAYIDYGIRPTQEGVRLACDPAFEAAMYRAGYEADITPLLAEVTCPVVVAYGTAGGGIGAACAPKVADQVPGARLIGIEGLTHLGPLERPALVAQSIQRFLDTPGA